ncbi:phage head morphogenesis protein, partial [Candidatus Falkowbacteria bacterium]|nr:phage head morphogenesis protein [Candidatus Falkowbacteria bacterium]
MTPQQFSQKLKKQQDELKRYIERDAFIFSGLKAHKQLSQALSLLKDDKGAIRPYHQFEQEIVKLNNSYNKLYLEAEYEFAVHSAQSAARWDGLSNDTDRYWLQYRTAQDERVREDHAALAGTTLPKDDPFWDSYYPPNGWRCRCVAVEVLARDNKLSDSKKAIEKGEVSTTQIGKNGKN